MHVSFVYFYSTPSSASPTKTYWRWTCWSFSCMVSFQVTWLKNGNKIFEYINGRNPPYRNFTIPGAVIDVRTWASSSSSSYFWASSSSSSCSCPIIACNPPPPPPLVSGTGSHHTWLCTFRVPSEQRRWWFCILVRPTDPREHIHHQHRVVVLIVTATPWIYSNGTNHLQLGADPRGRRDLNYECGRLLYEFEFQTDTKLGFS